MKYAKQLVVVFDHAARCHAMVDELSTIGVTATVIANGSSSFKSMLDNIDVDVELLLMHCECQHFALVIANLRSVASYSGIIAVGAFERSAQRVELLLAGADACLPQQVTGVELMAMQHALRRRTEKSSTNKNEQAASKTFVNSTISAAAEQFPRWTLRDKGWTLVSPEGVGLQLTYGERYLVELLSNSLEGRVSRKQLMVNKADTPKNSRAVDSLISRLRRKASEAGVVLPIKSVHGWGYSFAGQIEGVVSDTLGPVLLAENVPYELAEANSKLVADIRLAYHSQVTSLPAALSLMFQAKLNVKTGAQEGVEAQLYWRVGQSGAMRLCTSVYERLGLAVVSWLYECAFQVLCDELQSWIDDYKLHIAITLSLPLPVLMRLHEPWIQKLQSLRLNDGSFGIAVTDYDVAVKNSETQDLFRTLSALGVPVWLDEYVGTAENLHYLKQLDIHGVRMHFNKQGAVSQTMQHPVSLITMACKVCTSLGLKTVVTGITCASDKSEIAYVGADYLHGDFIFLPLSRDGVLLALASGL